MRNEVTNVNGFETADDNGQDIIEFPEALALYAPAIPAVPIPNLVFGDEPSNDLDGVFGLTIGLDPIPTHEEALAALGYVIKCLYPSAASVSDKRRTANHDTRTTLAILIDRLASRLTDTDRNNEWDLPFGITKLNDLSFLYTHHPLLAARLAVTRLDPTSARTWYALSRLLNELQWFGESARSYTRGCVVDWMSERWCEIDDLGSHVHVLEALDRIAPYMGDPVTMPYDKPISAILRRRANKSARGRRGAS